MQVLYGTDTYSATAAPYNPLSLSVSLLSHGYGTGTFSAYMGPNNTTVSDVANVWGNRGTQKHAGVWYDGPHENTSGYSNPVHLTYDFGTQIRITAGQCCFAQWGTAGTVTLEGSANGSTGWTTVRQFTAGTTWWRN